MAPQSDTMSPDPLALSLDGQDRAINHKYNARASPQPSTPKRFSRQNKGNVQLQDFYLTTPQAALLRTSSPTRSTAQTENLLSPWRIRVRVEAERNDGPSAIKKSSPSPVRPIGQWTKTTTVPLKDPDNLVLPSGKRPRGRPRKSIDGPVKRKGTPKPKRPSRKKSLEDRHDDTKEPVAEQATPSKKKKKPRKQETLEKGNAEAMQNHQDSEPKPVPKKGGSRKDSKSMSSAMAVGKISQEEETSSPIQRSEGAEADFDLDQFGDRTSSRAQRNIPSKALSEVTKEPITPTAVALGTALKRKRTTREASLSPKQPSGSRSQEGQNLVEKVANQEDPSDYLEAQRKDLQAAKSHMDPANEHREFDSIIESEGFSMVSVSTLPSVKQTFTVSSLGKVNETLSAPDVESHISQLEVVTREPKRKKGASRKSLALSNTQPIGPREPSTVANSPHRKDNDPASKSMIDESLHERLLSADHNSATEDRSPSIPPPNLDFRREIFQPAIGRDDGSLGIGQVGTSSASQDPPGYLQAKPAKIHDMMSQKRLDKAENGPDFQLRGYGPGTRRVLRDGLRLGEELEFNSSESVHSEQEVPTHHASGRQSSSLDATLDAFGPGTKRELRAGLRLGEELAKRHRVKLSKHSYDVDDEFPNLDIPKKPKLPTPSESDVASQSHKKSEVAYPELSAIHRQRLNEIRYPSLPADQLLSPEQSNDIDLSMSGSDVEPSDIESDGGNRMSSKADLLKPNSHGATEDTPLPLPVLQSERSEGGSARGPSGKTWREWEAEWQREREAVSRQIQEANASRVIVIDSSIVADQGKVAGDKENDGHIERMREASENGHLDIWQQEANESRDHVRKQGHNTSANAPEVLLPEAQIKPRRSKLPSPWRRQSGSNIIYSDEYPSTDPIPFLPSPEKKEPTTPLQHLGKRRSHDDTADFSNFSDFGRPVDECATVQFKRPRLVQSVEDRALARMEEEEMPGPQQNLLSDEEDGLGIIESNPASQLENSSPSFHRKRSFPNTIGGAKDPLVIKPAPDSDERQGIPGPLLLPRLRALHGQTSSLENSIQESTKAPAQLSTQSSSITDTRDPTIPSIRATSMPSGVLQLQRLIRPESRRQSQPPDRLQKLLSTQLSTRPPPTTHSQISSSVNPAPLAPTAPHLPSSYSSITTEEEVAQPPPHLSFTLHHPWTNAHYHVLQPLYLEAFSQSQVSSSYDPVSSPSSFLLGKRVNSQGWSKKIEAWELSVVDAFMAILLRDGVTIQAEKPRASSWWSGFKKWVDAAVGRQGNRNWDKLVEAKSIDETEVVKRVFSLWVGRVQRGEEDLGDGVAGVFDKRYKAREKVVKGLL